MSPLLVAAWFALVTGLLEGAILLLKRFAWGELIWISPHVIWMAPVGYLAVFAPAALALMWLRRWQAPERVQFLSFAIFGSLSTGSVLLLLLRQRVWLISIVLLALGAGIQLARVTRNHPRRFAGLLRRTSPVIALMIPALAVTLLGTAWLAERRGVRGLSEPPRTPSVLLIILDTVRAANLSVYGYDRPTTPALEYLARHAVLFQRAIATSSWTLPSHASIFTGQYPHALSADWITPLDRTNPTLAELFRDAGYFTGGFVANQLFCTRETGLERGFIHYEDYPFSVEQFWYSTSVGQLLAWLATDRTDFRRVSSRKNAAQINAHFLKWLGENQGRPFFAFLNYLDAHSPYKPPPGFRARYRGNSTSIDLYDGSISYLDYEVGSLLVELERRGRLRNTIVAITSDHGEHLGEHGLFEHGHSLYFPVLHVPLLLYAPGIVPSGITVAGPVSLRDLPATLLELASVPRPAGFPGTSLAERWGTGPQQLRSVALSEVRAVFNFPPWIPLSRGDMQSVVDGDLHYILNGDKREELYNFVRDPGEEHNLVQHPEHETDLIMFRRSLDSLGPMRR